MDNKEAEVAELQTTLCSKLKAITHKDQRLSGIQYQLAAREEELVAAAAAATAEAGEKAQEEFCQGDQEKEALEKSSRARWPGGCF